MTPNDGGFAAINLLVVIQSFNVIFLKCLTVLTLP